MGTARADAGRLNSMGGAEADGRKGHMVSTAATAGARSKARKSFMVRFRSCNEVTFTHQAIGKLCRNVVQSARYIGKISGQWMTV